MQQDRIRPTATLVPLSRVREEALALLASVPEGENLEPVEVALLRLAVHASVCTLDTAGMDHWIRCALDTGASPAQVHETLVVVSGLGVHTLMEGSRRVSAILRERDTPAPPLDEVRAAMRARIQGNDQYWVDFEREVPGFLNALLELSPEAYEAFFAYCAVPWRTGAVRARVKELLAMACDATPTHRYLPGMRLHLANAVRLGAGRTAILHALDIAAAAPSHPGVPAADTSTPTLYGDRRADVAAPDTARTTADWLDSARTRAQELCGHAGCRAGPYGAPRQRRMIHAMDDNFDDKAFRVYEVELTRCFPTPEDLDDGDDPHRVSWIAEWGLVGNSAGTEDTDVEDIAALVDEIVAEVREYATKKGRSIPIEWHVCDADWSPPPAGDTAAEALAAAGIVLPESVDPA